MKRHEVERLAHEVIDRVLAGQPAEDDGLVELKSVWPEHQSGARRIAAHANSVHAPHFLWLIGVDEKSRTIPGVSAEDPAKWFDQVRTYFDEGWAPSPFVVNIPRDGKTVVAILFDASGIPFVVKHRDHLEVPWRGSTQTRSAYRRELLQILSPLASFPTIHLSSGTLNLGYRASEAAPYAFDLVLDVYITPQDERPVVLPYHLMKAAVFADDGTEVFAFDELFALDDGEPTLLETLRSAPSRPRHIESTSSELIIAGPGRARFVARGEIEFLDPDIMEKTCEVRFLVEPATRKARHVISNRFKRANAPHRAATVSWLATWPVSLMPRDSGL